MTKEKKLAVSLNFINHYYINDVLSLNNSNLVTGERIYLIKSEIRDASDTVKSVSYLDFHLEIDNCGQTLRHNRRLP